MGTKKLFDNFDGIYNKIIYDQYIIITYLFIDYSMSPWYVKRKQVSFYAFFSKTNYAGSESGETRAPPQTQSIADWVWIVSWHLECRLPSNSCVKNLYI